MRDGGDVIGVRLLSVLLGLVISSSSARAQETQVVALGYNLGPVPPSLTNAVEVGVIGYSIAALRADGSVAEWGNGASDPGVSNLVTMVTGWTHGVGLRADGTITGWGDDSYGEITGFPPDLTNAAMFAVGTLVTLAVLPDGSIVGRGDPSNPALAIPEDATNVVSVAAVENVTMALRADGTVVEWSYAATNRHSELSNVVAIATGGYNSAALLWDGSVVGWPAAAPDGLTNITAIAGGGYDFMALRSDGSVTGWGCPCHGAVDTPPDLTNVTAFAIGGSDGYTESAFVIGLPSPPPPVLSIARDNDLVRVQLSGLPRHHYVLEESTDLSSGANWRFKQNVLLGSTAQTVHFPTADGNRFYRAQLLP